MSLEMQCGLGFIVVWAGEIDKVMDMTYNYGILIYEDMKFGEFDQKALTSEKVVEDLLKKRILGYLAKSKAVLSMDARMIRKMQSLMEKSDKKELEALYFALGVEKKQYEEIEHGFLQTMSNYCEELLVSPMKKLKKSK